MDGGQIIAAMSELVCQVTKVGRNNATILILDRGSWVAASDRTACHVLNLLHVLTQGIFTE